MVWNHQLSRLSSLFLSLVITSTIVPSLAQEVRVGAAAPDFKATDSNGNAESLDQYRGKYVVLEWHNQGCPYTKKHYTSGNMQSLQKEWTAKGVVWLTVISSAPGEQGYVTGSQENSYLSRMHAVLLDSDSKVARMYSAKTTPQIVVIDPGGKVIYDGAIDDRPTDDPEDVKGAKNYVNEALGAAMAGKPVPTPYTRPYGCSVKYAE
jgi:peroxiredoxin